VSLRAERAAAAAARREAKAAAAARAARTHARYVERTYGLEPGEYDRMLEAQGGRCAICMKQPRAKRLSVDHDHNTGRVRALLCQPCNRGLRSFEHDYPAAQNAANYIQAIADAYLENTRDSTDTLARSAA
jgi:hypothetical protein